MTHANTTPSEIPVFTPNTSRIATAPDTVINIAVRKPIIPIIMASTMYPARGFTMPISPSITLKPLLFGFKDAPVFAAARADTLFSTLLLICCYLLFKPIILKAHLCIPQLRICPVSVKQLLMSSALNHISFIKNIDSLCILDISQSV